MTQPTPEHAVVSRFEAAYERVRDELMALMPSDYVSINTDVPVAVTRVVGACPGIQALRPRVVADLPNLDIARFDKLETYALALGYAHGGYMTASQPAEVLEALNGEGSALRELLVSDAKALASRMLIDGDALKHLKGIKGYRHVAFDLLALARLFHDHWPAIQGKCALQLDDLQRAALLADHIVSAVGHRDQATTTVIEAADMRHRAYTLFVGAYDHVQRAVRFLRWKEKDWETIAPSIYNATRSHHRESNDEPGPSPLSPSPPQTAVADA
jgi:hypothetical protein